MMGRGVVLRHSLAWDCISRTELAKDLLGSENDELGGTTVQGLGGPGRKERLATIFL
jgi:hypothetical protein